jgi:SAM-dependent methyltransferase
MVEREKFQLGRPFPLKPGEKATFDKDGQALLVTPEVATQPPDALPTGEARARGAYYTPDRLAVAICRTLRDECGISPDTILEPGCGGGAFLRAAAAIWPKAGLVGVDLMPACQGPGLVLTADLFDIRTKHALVIGNPDFSIAEKVVRHGLELLEPNGRLAFLLRAAFLGSEGRVPLYRDHPLRFFQPIAQRPSFTDDGKTDPMEYGLYVWRQGFNGRGEILPPLVWR